MTRTIATFALVFGLAWLCIPGQCAALDFTFSVDVDAVDDVVFFDPDTGEGGFTMRVMGVENPGSPGFPHGTQGYTLAVAHDPDVLTAVALHLPQLMAEPEPAFVDLRHSDDGTAVRIAIVYTFDTLDTLPWADPTELLVVDYETNPAGLGESLITTDLVFDPTVEFLGMPTPPLVSADGIYDAIVVGATVTLLRACPNATDDDADGDGLCADEDNCPLEFNPLQEDLDGDGTGDLCDCDSEELAKLTASDAAATDNLGGALAISGDYAITGVPLDDNPATSFSTGSAYVLSGGGGIWEQAAKLVASDAAKQDFFGTAVGISGTRAVIGAPGDDDKGDESGSAYVFEVVAGVWTQVAKLKASDGLKSDGFGRAVAIDGNIVLVGAPGNDTARGVNSGSVYVFERRSRAWVETGQLIARDGAKDDAMGSSVALSGTRAIIGAPADDDGGTNSGSAYIFELNRSLWTQSAKLTASDDAAQDLFGGSVALDGSMAVIGAIGNDDDGQDSGSAYVFEHGGTSWSEAVKLTASDGARSDAFGGAVDISGPQVIVGASLDDDGASGAGSAYLFRVSHGAWIEEAKLTVTPGAADHFGKAVGISGTIAIAGAFGDDDAKSNAGAVFIFSAPCSEF